MLELWLYLLEKQKERVMAEREAAGHFSPERTPVRVQIRSSQQPLKRGFRPFASPISNGVFQFVIPRA